MGEEMRTDVVPATAEPAVTGTADLPLTTMVALHLVPGALIVGAFVAFAPIAENVGFPPIAALLAAIALVLVPFELGVVVWAGRGQGGGLSAALSYRRPIRLRTWLWLVPALIAAAFLGFGLHAAIEPGLIASLFAWIPEWFVRPIDPERVGDYSAGAWYLTLAAFFVLNGLIGPIVEELYFRGYLLPRMQGLGRWAPLVNVSLFSLYHFWSPWQIVARILAIGPMVYAVQWKRNVYLGMVVHCTLNTISVALVVALVTGRL
jgi:membrane protease YdiL (CAAX protease family)